MHIIICSTESDQSEYIVPSDILRLTKWHNGVWKYVASWEKSRAEITEEEYEKVKKQLTQLNMIELSEMAETIKVESVKKAWAKKNMALFGLEVSSTE